MRGLGYGLAGGVGGVADGGDDMLVRQPHVRVSDLLPVQCLPQAADDGGVGPDGDLGGPWHGMGMVLGGFRGG